MKDYNEVEKIYNVEILNKSINESKTNSVKDKIKETIINGISSKKKSFTLKNILKDLNEDEYKKIYDKCYDNDRFLGTILESIEKEYKEKYPNFNWSYYTINNKQDVLISIKFGKEKSKSINEVTYGGPHIKSHDFLDLLGGRNHISGLDIIEILGNNDKANKIINSKRWTKKYELEKQDNPELTPLQFLDLMDEKSVTSTDVIIRSLMHFSTPEEIQKAFMKLNDNFSKKSKSINEMEEGDWKGGVNDSFKTPIGPPPAGSPENNTTTFKSISKNWISNREGILKGKCNACGMEFIEPFSGDEIEEYSFCPHCGRKKI